MLFASPSRRRSSRPRAFVFLLAALTLPVACALAQPPSPPLPVPASNTTAASPTNSTATPAAATQLYSGVASSIEPLKPPPPPLGFDAFASDYTPKKDLVRRWLDVSVGFTELDQPPPPGPAGQPPQTIFYVNNLPAEIVANMHFIEFTSLIGAKSRYENVSVIDHDPHGMALPFSLPMGQIIYFLAREDTDQGLAFDFFYYDANSLNWIPSPVDQNLLLPQPTVIRQWQSLVIPADKYILMLTTERAGPPRPGSTARSVVLYGYVVLYMHLVMGPSHAAGADQPSAPPTGDVLAAPPVNRGDSLMPGGPPPAPNIFP
jgi:hypothetical protein